MCLSSVLISFHNKHVLIIQLNTIHCEAQKRDMVFFEHIVSANHKRIMMTTEKDSGVMQEKLLLRS